jgi:predicted metal-dependent hydrolase
MTIPYQGQLLTLTQGPGRTVQIIGDSLLVPGDPSQMLPRLKAWLKLRARDRLVAATDHYASKLGRRVSRITLRDTRSRWGSCTADGALMYSWRLIMAPPAVLDYVAAHEVAHLIEMNHSERFWGVVDQLYPKWQSERAWLRVHGGALQRFRFEQS